MAAAWAQEHCGSTGPCSPSFVHREILSGCWKSLCHCACGQSTGRAQTAAARTTVCVAFAPAGAALKSGPSFV